MSDRPAVRVVEALFAAQWAMTEEYLRTMLAIAERNHEITPEALEAMRARRVADAENGLGVRDGIGVIPVVVGMFGLGEILLDAEKPAMQLKQTHKLSGM